MLVVLTTHPIQYQVPLWQELARDGRVAFEVWYLTRQATDVSHDREFGKAFAWDLDMLSGYPHRFLDVDPSVTPNDFCKCRLPRNFTKSLQEAKAKAIWIQGWQVAAYWQAAWAAKRVGAEVWLRGESNDLAPTPFWKRVIKSVVLGQFFQRVDRFLYIGSANRRLYLSCGVPEERLYSAPYAVDNERFIRQAESIRGQRSQIRRQWKIPEDAFCVLFCGKFIPKKRPLDLVRAAQLLITDNSLTNYRFPNVHLLFVGSGELGGELRANCSVVFDQENSALTSDLRPLTSRTKPPASFAGFLNQTEISRAYVAADCLVLPSDYRETWGLVVNEAMMSGLPCIISDQCGCAEDLVPLGTNEVFTCGDHLQLAGRILNLTKSDRQVDKAGPASFSTTVATVASLYG